MTIHNAKAGEYGLRVGLAWWMVGMELASAYSAYVYRHFAGKVKIEGGASGY